MTDARYRKLYPRLWRDRDFLQLDYQNRLLALYLLAGPQGNSVGCYVFSLGTASEDFGFSLGIITRRFKMVCAQFGWQYDPASRVLFIPSWWKWNKPENAIVLKGALKDCHELPETPLYETLAACSRNVCERLGVTFPKRIPEPSPIQEQYSNRSKAVQEERTVAAPRPPVENSVENPEPPDPPEPTADAPPVRSRAPSSTPHVPVTPPGQVGDWTPTRVLAPFAVVAALVRAVLADGQDWSHPGGEADLLEELKTHCAKARLGYDTELLRKALDSERHKAKTRRTA